MKSISFLLSGLLALAGVAAQAGELYTPEQYLSPSVSTTTRAEVKQSVLRDRAAGTLLTNDIDQPQFVGTQIDKSRAEIKREVLQARAAHQLDHNDVDQPTMAFTGSDKTRAEVRNEYLAARKLSADPRDRGLFAN